jgi:hypothetical protein
MAKRIPQKFAMFSKAGNLAVRQMVIAALDEFKDCDLLCAAIWHGIEKIGETHSEAFDTEVREHILYAVHDITGFSLDYLYPRIKFGKFDEAEKCAPDIAI